MISIFRAAGALLAVLLLTLGGAMAADLDPAVTKDDVDLAASTAFIDGKPLPAPDPAIVYSTLRLSAPPIGANRRPIFWQTGELPGRDRTFRIGFKHPVAIGTIISTYTGPVTRPLQPMTGQWISVLKAGAPYPGDVANDEDWTILPTGSLKTLPPGLTTRALRFSERSTGDTITPRNTEVGPNSLFAGRYYSALNLGAFKKTGHEKTPEVWLGAWSQPQNVVGLVFPNLAESPKVEILKPDTDLNPVVAGSEYWKTLPSPAPGEMVTYVIPHPFLTKGLRLTAPIWRREGNFPGVIPMVDLGDTAEAPSLDVPPPPYKVTYNMPMDGFSAIDILNKAGERVRHLSAEVAHTKGPVEERWDLKDDAGNLVPPGDYTIRGIARPPFKLTYQLSVYNSGQPAWWAPAPGKGGGSWTADHTPPSSIQAMGDIVWIGSQVTENGNVLIAVDKEGNKLWGEHAVSWGFSGPERIATDGRYGYLVNNTLVQRVDPKLFDSKTEEPTKTVYEFHHTPELPGGGDHWADDQGGAVAKKGKLYVAFCGPPESWLKPPFAAEDVDTGNSEPVAFLNKGNGHRAWKNDKIYGLTEYDEMMKLWAAMLLERTPVVSATISDAPIPSSTQAVFGDAPKEGPMQGLLTVAMKKNVTIGTVMVPDTKIQVFALKPGVELSTQEPQPADVGLDAGGGGADAAAGNSDDADWIPLEMHGKPGFPGLALAPKGGITTKALRFKANRLSHTLILAHRFTDVAPDAERYFTEGDATPTGGWKISRSVDQPITEYNPAEMELVWKQPTTMRGISLDYPTGAVMVVERWSGPAGDDPKAHMKDDADWTEIQTVEPGVNWMGSPEPPTIENVDFGDSLPIRALRIRAIHPEGAYNGSRIPMSGVNGPQVAGFASVVAYQSLGDAPPKLPVVLGQRITELNLPDDPSAPVTIEREIPIKDPGNLAIDAAGTLYAVSDGQVVTVPLDGVPGTTPTPHVIISREKVQDAGDITFDADGLLYVSDLGAKDIKVFDPKTAALVRTIGHSGGQQVGPWDPLRFDKPSGITIDSSGKLWVTDHSYQPKRVERLTRTGEVEKTFLGPTQYGGGGKMDPGNKNLVYYNGMKFVVDWPTYTWKLDSIVWRKGVKECTDAGQPDRVFYVNGHRYLVDWGYDGSSVAQIAVEKNDVAVPLAAMGNLGEWGDVARRPDLAKAFGNLQGQLYTFVWYDKNGDGIPEANEVQIVEKGNARQTFTVGEDLAFIWPGGRLRPESIRADGIPTYDIAKIQAMPLTAIPGYEQRIWETADGRTFVIGDRLVSADGQSSLWQYTDKYAVHDGYYISGYGYDRPPGVLNAEHFPIGHFTLGKEEYFVTNSDQGDWFCFTGDGMLAGCLFGGPTGYGLRRWTMPEWDYGKTQLEDIRLAQEHYQGCVVKADDGNVYAIAGHNHASIVKIDGLEQLQRLPATTLVVTAADEDAASAWALKAATINKIKAEPKAAKLAYVTKPMDVNGSLDDWPDDLFVTIYDYWKRSLTGADLITHSEGAFAYDDKNLYVAARTIDDAPYENQAQDPARLFKSGAALDVTLGLDPNANPNRTQAAAGDVRILVAQIKGKPTVVLYRPVVPGTPDSKKVRFVSPVATTEMDEVRVLDDATAAFGVGNGQKSDWAWVVAAAIPWKDLGVDPPKVGTKLKGDIGLLLSDQNGISTARRYYWSAKSQTMVADLAGEARLAPSLWGDIYASEPDETMKFGPTDVDVDMGPGP